MVTFEAAASFIGNEVLGRQLFESEGVLYQGGKGGAFMQISYEDEGIRVLFQGPVLFSGNKGLVSCCISYLCSTQWYCRGELQNTPYNPVGDVDRAPFSFCSPCPRKLESSCVVTIKPLMHSLWP